ncbi:MAG: alpha/beta hydrolase-fold protein [Phycisphaerales bacterium]
MTSLHRKLLLTGFLFSPVVILALLINWIAVSLQNPNIHKLPPVGAGAGDTGGANAIGEEIKAIAEARELQTPITPAIHVPAGSGPAPRTEGIANADGDTVNPVDLETGFFIVVSDKSGKSSASSPIYLAGSINGWNPKDERFKFTAQSDMKWRLHVTKEMLATKPSTLEFKFTRGSWDLEEVNADYSIPANKLLGSIKKSDIKPGEAPQIEYTIVAWVDSNPKASQRHVGDEYRSIEATGTVKRLQVRGGAGSAEGRLRDLLVWLPPGYDKAENAEKKYPVLYMHDGQHVFEKYGPAPGEWKADETATQLINDGTIVPIIIVGIPNSEGGRAAEYSPVEAIPGVKPEGGKHVEWLLSEVMPRVERTFRVSTDPEDTVIGGASLGAAISIHAITMHPERFGGLLAESLPLMSGDTNAWKQFADRERTWPGKVFFGVGGKEWGTDQAEKNAKLVEAVTALNTKAEGGTNATKTKLMVDQEAAHNEDAWAKRFPDALKFFFGR